MAITHTFFLLILVHILFPQSNGFEQPKKLFILAGQSNMAGRGGVKANMWDRYIPPDSSPDQTKIFRFNVNRSWEVASEPLHADIDSLKTCGVGLGMAFANAIKNFVELPIGLIPCAVGGTSISSWARGQKAYDEMVERAQEAAFCGGEISALLWFQGESDTDSLNQVDSYREKLEEFFQNLRTDLCLPSLPIIQVAIASGDNGYQTNKTFLEQIRDIQKTVELPHVAWVDADSLDLNGDHVHLNTTSQVVMGYRLAFSYYNNFVVKDADGPKN